MKSIEQREAAIKNRINFLCKQGTEIFLVELIKDVYGKFSLNIYEKLINNFKHMEKDGKGKLISRSGGDHTYKFIPKKKTTKSSKTDSIIAEIEFYINSLQSEKDDNVTIYLDELLTEYYPEEIEKAFIMLQAQGVGRYYPGKDARFEVGASEVDIPQNKICGPSHAELQAALLKLKTNKEKIIRR